MNEPTMPARGVITRPDTILEGVAGDTWQAYNAMETTKRRHFELLQILDSKKKNYNLDPSEKEKSLLASLLKDHDEQVKRFTLASSALKNADVDAHIALFNYIGLLSDTAEPKVTH